MAVAEGLWSWVYPIILLSASLIRVNGFSAFYLVAFLMTRIWSTHSLSRTRIMLAKVLVNIILIVSGVAVLGQIAFQCVSLTNSQDGQSLLEDGASQTRWWSLVGWTKFNHHVLRAFQYFVPDLAVLGFTLFFFILFIKGKIFTYNSGIDNETGPTVKRLGLVGGLMLLFFAVAGAAYASLLTMIYFIITLVWILLLAFDAPFFRTANVLWRFGTLFATLHGVFFYMYQLEVIHRAIPSSIAELFGLYHYSDFIWQLWPVYIGLIALILLFFVCTQWSRHVSLLRELHLRSTGLIQSTFHTPQYSDSEDYSRPTSINVPTSNIIASLVMSDKSLAAFHAQPTPGKSSTSTTVDNRTSDDEPNAVLRFFSKQGWKLALVGYILVALVIVSLMSFVLLFVFFLGTLLSAKAFSSYFVPLLLYSIGMMLIQYIFVVPFGFYETDTLRSIGLIKHDPVIFFIGIQIAVSLLLALYLRAHSNFVLQQQNDDNVQRRKAAARRQTRWSYRKKSVRKLSRLQMLLLSIVTSKFARVASKLWFLAKQVALKNCYRLALAGLYVCALQSVNLLNAGYILFFMVFFLSYETAKRYWLLLVFYCELVISLLYVWQVSWTAGVEHELAARLIGLQHFNNIWTGLVWHLIIMTLCIVQTKINEVFARGFLFSKQVKRHLGETKVEDLHLPPSLERAILFISNLYNSYGLGLTYLGLFLVGVLSDISLIATAYLVLLYLLFIIHMVSKKPRKHVKRLWPALVVFTGLLLLIRYATQFDELYAVLERYYTYSDVLTLVEIGLVNYPIHQLFIKLIPNAVALILSVWQWHVFREENAGSSGVPRTASRITTASEPKETTPLLAASAAPAERPIAVETPAVATAATASSAMPSRAQRFVMFCRRVVILHSAKVTVLTLFAVSISDFSALNFVLLLTALLLVIVWRPQVTFGLGILVYCQLLTLAQMVYQLTVIDKDVGLVNWFGFRVERHGLVTFDIVAGYFFIMLFVLLQHVALHWRDKLIRQKLPPEEQSAPSPQWLLFIAKEKESHDPCPLFNVNEDDVFSPNHTQSPHGLSASVVIGRIQWYLGNFYSLHGYYIFLAVLLITIFIHNDALSVLYLVVFGIANITPKATFVRRMRLLVWVFLTVLIGQYVLVLGLPPPLSTPWRHLPVGLRIWLNLTPSPWELAGDFVCLFLARLLLKVPHERLQTASAAVATYNHEELLRNYHALVETHLLGRKQAWNKRLEVVVMRLAIRLIPLAVFITATAKADLLSLGYVAFSLYFMFRGDTLVRRRSKSWKVARLYNYAVLLVKTLFQISLIFVDDSITSEHHLEYIDAIVGLRRITLRTAFTAKGVLVDVIIFLLLALQHQLFETAEFVEVLMEQKVEELLSREKAKLAAKWFEKKILRQYLNIIEEMKRRRSRLDELRRARFSRLTQTGTDDKTEEELVAQSSATSTSPMDSVAAAAAASGLPPPPESELSEIELARLRYLEKKKRLQLQKERDAKLSKWQRFKRALLRLVDRIIAKLEDLYHKKSEEKMKREFAAILASGQAIISVEELRRFIDEGVFGQKTVRRRSGSRRERSVSSVKGKQRTATSDGVGLLSPAPISDDERLGNALHGTSPAVDETEEDAREASLEEELQNQEEQSITAMDTLNEITRQRAQSLHADNRERDDIMREIEEAAHSSVESFTAKKLEPPEKKVYFFEVADEEEEEEEEEEKEDKDKKRKKPKKTPSSSGGGPEDSGRLWRLLHGFYKVLANHTHLVCYVVMVINHAVNANVLSTFYPVSIFAYAVLHFPRPYKDYWRVVLGYATVVLCAKFLFQISIFCICNEAHESNYNFSWVCDDADKCGAHNIDNIPHELLLPWVVGLIKYKGAFLAGAFWDLAVLLVVLWHRYMLIMRGWWDPIPFEVSAGRKLVDDAKQEIAAYRKSIRKKAEQEIIKEIVIPEEETASSSSSRSRSGSLATPRTMTSPTIMSTTGDDIVVAEKRDYESSDEDTDRHEEDDMPEEQTETEGLGEDEFGEVSDRTSPSCFMRLRTGLVQLLVRGPVEYYRELLNTNSPSKDVYVFYFFADVVCLMLIALLPQEFTATPQINAYEIFVKSRIPQVYVGFLLLQFGLIIIDRVVYLYQALKVKLILQYALLVFFHVVLFFVLPRENLRPFSQSWSLMVFYLVKCVYFYYSGRQICHGFPLKVEGQFLTRSRRPGIVAKTAFTVYRALPFAFELRTLLDWIVAKTTLDFYQWLKLEDIYAELYMVKCRVVAEDSDERPPGGKQRKFNKCLTGVTVFVILCVVIWLPLIVLSAGSPAIGSGSVEQVSVAIGLQSYVPFYTASFSANITGVSESRFDTIQQLFDFVLSDQIRDTQVVSLPQFSETFWQINNDSLAQMMSALSRNTTKRRMHIEFSYSIVRNGVSGNVLLLGKSLIPLRANDSLSLKDVVNGSLASYCVPNIYQRAFSIPVTGTISYPSTNMPVGLVFSLRILNEANDTAGRMDLKQQYFQVTQSNDNCGLIASSSDELQLTNQLFTAPGPQFITITDEILTGLASSLATAGIMGLYVGVVLSVGRFLRLYVSGLVVKIMFEDMPNPDDIIQLCEDLYMARADNDLLLEEDLYNELIQLYRSPERLIIKTRKKPKQD